MQQQGSLKLVSFRTWLYGIVANVIWTSLKHVGYGRVFTKQAGQVRTAYLTRKLTQML